MADPSGGPAGGVQALLSRGGALVRAEVRGLVEGEGHAPTSLIHWML